MDEPKHEHSESEHRTESEHHAEAEHVVHEPREAKKDPFSIFGKIVAIVIVVAVLVGGGIYIGTTNKGTTMDIKKKNSPSLFPSEEPTSTVLPTGTSITTSALDKSIIVAGLKDSAFKTYQADYPSSWTVNEEKSEVTNTLTLQKGEYSIKIYQAPMGGGGCSYGDGTPKMGHTMYENYSELQGSTYKLRMSWNGEKPTTYSVCSLSEENESSWIQPTPYGVITVKAPSPSDPDTMSDVEAILKSLVSK